MAAGKTASHAQPPRLSRGFTLVEIAVALGIIALVLGALLPLFTAQAANARINATRTRQDTIRQALISYLGQHGHLPCPADGTLGPAAGNYGHEARSASNSLPAGLCDLLPTGGSPAAVHSYDTSAANPAIPAVSVYRGVVPWLDLGLPEDTVNDGWNQRISYVVSSLAVTGYATREAISGMLGGILVCNAFGGSSATLLTPVSGVTADPCTTPGSAQPLISEQTAAVALISHGENGFGAYLPPQGSGAVAAGPVKPWQNGQASAAEIANIDLNQNVLVQAPYGKGFDDIVLWLTPAALTAPLIQSGALPSLQSLTAGSFAAANAAILASLTSSVTATQRAFPATSASGGSFTTSEFFLCLPIGQAQTNGTVGPLFATWSGTGLGTRINPGVLPPGSIPTANAPALGSDAALWKFAYEGQADLSQGGNARESGKAGQVNYDPWGNPLLYTETLPETGIAQATVYTLGTPAAGDPAHPYAYILYSLGPDGIPGTADDAALGVRVGELQTALSHVVPLVASRPLGDVPGSCPAITPSGGGSGGSGGDGGGGGNGGNN